MVGVDPSDAALRAAAYAVGLARRQHADLIAVYVRRPTGVGAGMAGAEAMIAATAEQVGDDLERVIGSACGPLGVRMTFIRRCGNPTLELIAVAERFEVDAITVGVSRRFGHKLFGSAATRLIRRGRWPVTVVP